MDQPLQQQDVSNPFIPVYDSPDVRSHLAGAGLYFEQSYINCYPETYRNLSQYSKPDIKAIKRPGSVANILVSSTIATTTSAATDTLVCQTNTVVTQLYDVYVAAFFDAVSSNVYIVQYRPIAGTSTLIGTISSGTVTDMVFITEIMNGPLLLPGIAVSYQASNKSFGTGYYSITVAGVFTATSLQAIASGSFPSNLATPRIITGPFQHMNGHTYIMTIDGFIFESQFLAGSPGTPDITSWNTNATVTSSQYPDRGVGIYRYKHLL